MLVLPIKKKWFDMIARGEKKEEYREIKPYWTSRFKAYLPRRSNFIPGMWTYSQFIVILRNGYSKNSPGLKCTCCLIYGYGKTKWGAEAGKRYYVFKIMKVEKVGDNQ